MKNKQLINIHAKRYVEEVFKKRLEEEGFRCPDDKYLCWYRIQNSELINSIVFYSPWHNLPLMMDIGYEILPLFTRPTHITNVNYNSPLDRHDVFHETALIEECPKDPEPGFGMYAPYSEEIKVYAPSWGEKGIYSFDQVLLPKFNAVRTIEECYLFHKQAYLDWPPEDENEMFSNVTRTYIDEAIYVDDSEIYPKCRKKTMEAIEMYTWLIERKPNKRELKEILQHWEQLKVALFDGGREEYLNILEQRKNENTLYLKKKFGMDI